MSYELVEKIAGLASRLTSVITVQTDNRQKATLMELQDRLTKLTLATIVLELKADQAEYRMAIKGLNEAIEYMDQIPGKISPITKSIRVVTRAVQLTEKVVKSVAPV